MATRQDDGRSRLWRGMRHLIFGEDTEPTLREEIEFEVSWDTAFTAGFIMDASPSAVLPV